MEEEKIINLWRWFYTNEKRIRESLHNELKEEQNKIVQEIDNHVLGLGMFSWSIEMGEMKDWAFTISPNGDEELLKESQEIISHAPELESWEFHYYKQPKNWDRKLKLFDAEYDVVEIDASNWNYTMKKSGKSKFDLFIEAGNIGHLDNETANTAANLVVLNEIGEEKRILYINSIDFSDKTNDDLQRSCHISKLRELIS